MAKDRKPSRSAPGKGTAGKPGQRDTSRTDLSRRETGRPLTEKRGGYPGTTPVDQMEPPPDNLGPGAKPSDGDADG